MAQTTNFNAIDYDDADIALLPREQRGPLNARIWVDGTGQVNIELEGGGYMTLREEEDPIEPW